MAGIGMWLGGGFMATALLACTSFGLAPGAETTDSDQTVPAAPDAGVIEAAPELDAGTVSVTDAAPVALADAHWVGALPVVAPVAYGGTGACDYTVTFSNVTVNVAIANGAPTDATITATLKISSTDVVCLNKSDSASGTEQQTYTFTTSELTPDSLRLDLAPGPTNGVQASLILEGDFTGAASTVSLTWTRSDEPDTPALQWAVNASVPIVQVPH